MKLEQGTPEWLEWRRSGIGSSDAPVIMKESPWSTPFQLWEIKTKRAQEKEANDAMKRGTELEPKARAAYEELTGIKMPPITIEHPTFPFIRASLDGINQEKGILLEIKAPGPTTHAMAVAGKIPEHYRWQLVHQMLAANINTAHYFSFDGEKGVLVEVKRSEQLEINLLKKETDFWELVKKDEAPEFTDRDYELIKSSEIEDRATAYRQLCQQIEILEEEKESVRNELVSFASGRRILCNGVMVYSATRKGNIDYTKIPVLQGLDLEPYRKKPSTVTTVKIKRAGHE